LCNAGVIALVRPVPVDRAVLTFYLPLAFITTTMVSGFKLTKCVPDQGMSRAPARQLMPGRYGLGTFSSLINRFFCESHI
jgi:hypothetical protein